MTTAAQALRDVSFRAEPGPHGAWTLVVEGRLDAGTTGSLWSALFGWQAEIRPRELVLDAARIDYCDGIGAGLLVELARRQERSGGRLEVRGLRDEYAQLLALFESARAAERPSPPRRERGFFEEVGRATAGLGRDLYQLVAFVGELSAALVRALGSPHRVRWRDVLTLAERAGVEALPILALITFMIGLIIAFEAAQALRLFGAEIFVADLVALSALRELGPLMTAILLAGRSGSAFAAELGTMTVNAEVDALRTMGLEPVRFLTVPRVLAGMLVVPILTLVGDFFALLGGAAVFGLIGFPLVTYVNQIQTRVELSDLTAGLAKGVVFGVLVAAVGCLRGMQTGSGASAVGLSATRAVVSGIFLIILTDGVFSVVYHALGI